jgi:phosphoribosylglycinamide formyltransferase-1
MRKLGPRVLDRFRPSILNTHPALLPKYGGLGMYGSRVHKAILAAGEKQSGATVHIVDGTYDTGPILRQKAIAIAETETSESLAAKVKMVECDLLIEILMSIEDRSLNLRKNR